MNATPEATEKRLAAAIGASAVALVLIVGACSSDNSENSGNEVTEAPEGAEGSGSAEATEAGYSEGAGGGEAAEGGTVNLLTPNQTYDEIQSGARLILAFDPAANAFTGTVENTTSSPLTRARVEVHLSNGTELGPTTPTDLAPGEILPINLSSTAAAFDIWSAHPEVGSAEGGEETEAGAGEDAEGSEGGSGDGPEGTEGGQAATGSTTHLSSTGVSRGVHASQQLATGESYAGKLNDLELAISFDAANDTFVGRVKNEANQGLCNTTVGLVLDGGRAAPQSVLIPALEVGGRADFMLDAGNANFTSWQAETGTFSCTTVVSDAGEGGESSSGESGSEGSGAESGEETSPSTAISQAATGNFNNLDYRVAYDQATNAFRGTVTNNTGQIVCGSRLEVHMAVGSKVIELGPTIGVDLKPGETLDLVLSADPVTPETYSLHPESSPCS